jgi:hypothetical protein
MSCSAARIISLEELAGMDTLVGNHDCRKVGWSWWKV